MSKDKTVDLLPEELDALGRDPWGALAEMRTNLRIPPEQQAKYDFLHKMFDSIGREFADNKRVLRSVQFAFVYGANVGAYHAAELRPTMLRQFRRSLSSLGGRSSAEARGHPPWHEAATTMAIKLREEHPTWAQEKLAEKVAEHLRDLFTERKNRVGTDTLKRFISGLEREGRLPRRRNLGG